MFLSFCVSSTTKCWNSHRRCWKLTFSVGKQVKGQMSYGPLLALTVESITRQKTLLKDPRYKLTVVNIHRSDSQGEAEWKPNKRRSLQIEEFSKNFATKSRVFVWKYYFQWPKALWVVWTLKRCYGRTPWFNFLSAHQSQMSSTPTGAWGRLRKTLTWHHNQ